MTGPCPHCGGDTAVDAPVTRGRWWLSPVAAFLDGDRLPLTRAQARVLYAIARAKGDPVMHDALPDRTTAAGLHAHVAGIRKVLGERCPVRLVRGRGFAWSAAL